VKIKDPNVIKKVVKWAKCYKNWNYYAGGYLNGYVAYGFSKGLIQLFEKSIAHKRELAERS